MQLVQGQAVLARYAGEEFPAVVDRYWPGSAYQQVKPTDGRWITPVVVHVDDIKPLSEATHS